METTILKEALQNANTCNGDTACQCPNGKYYVSAVDGPSYFLMAGPYSTHAAAQAHRDIALGIADKIDGRAWFMSWGTVRMADDCEKQGVLNKHKLI